MKKPNPITDKENEILKETNSDCSTKSKNITLMECIFYIPYSNYQKFTQTQTQQACKQTASLLINIRKNS